MKCSIEISIFFLSEKNYIFFAEYNPTWFYGITDEKISQIFSRGNDQKRKNIYVDL